METFFDFLAVGCFGGLVIAFFRLTARDARSLWQLLIPGLAFAVGNQIGNAGMTFLAIGLILAGVGFAVFIIRTS